MWRKKKVPLDVKGSEGLSDMTLCRMLVSSGEAALRGHYRSYLAYESWLRAVAMSLISTHQGHGLSTL